MRSGFVVWAMTALFLGVAIDTSIAQPPAGGGLPPMAATGMGPPGRGGPPPGPRGIGPEELAQLGLTDQQRTRVEALHDDAMRSTIQTDAAARIAELDLQRMIEASPADTIVIAKQVERIGALRVQMLATRVRTEVAVRALLTPQQRAKLKTLLAERGPGPGAGPRP